MKFHSGNENFVVNVTFSGDSVRTNYRPQICCSLLCETWTYSCTTNRLHLFTLFSL